MKGDFNMEWAELLHILIITCPLACLAGVIDAMVGGGGLITIPAYMLAGLPPHTAIATNKCSSTLGTLVAVWEFVKSKNVHWISTIAACVGALLGSPLGAMLALNVDQKYLQWFIVISVPLVAIAIFCKKDFGESSKVQNLSSLYVILISALIGFAIGIYDGFFGPGTGTFLMLGFTVFTHFDLLTATGNAKVVNLASNVGALVTFAISGAVLWQVGLPTAAFCMIGNLIGARLAVKKGTKAIRPMLFVVLTILTVKLIYDLLVG